MSKPSRSFSGSRRPTRQSPRREGELSIRRRTRAVGVTAVVREAIAIVVVAVVALRVFDIGGSTETARVRSVDRAIAVVVEAIAAGADEAARIGWIGARLRLVVVPPPVLVAIQSDACTRARRHTGECGGLPGDLGEGAHVRCRDGRLGNRVWDVAVGARFVESTAWEAVPRPVSDEVALGGHTAEHRRRECAARSLLEQ